MTLAELSDMVETWHHTSLAVTDLATEVDFYQKAFGFQIIFQNPGMTDQIQRMTSLQQLQCDLAQLRHPVTGHVLELIAFSNPDETSQQGRDTPTAPGMAHVAFVVPDLTSAMQRLELLGATPLGEVTRFDSAHAVYYRTPGGSFLELEMLRQEDPK